MEDLGPETKGDIPAENQQGKSPGREPRNGKPTERKGPKDDQREQKPERTKRPDQNRRGQCCGSKNWSIFIQNVSSKYNMPQHDERWYAWDYDCVCSFY